MRFSPEELAEACSGRLVQRGSRPIAGVFIDSRRPVVGAAFVAIEAARDGHAFVADAVRAGASAVVQRPGHAIPEGVTVVEVGDTTGALQALGAVARARITGPVVAVTGSNGKTTTKALIAAVLRTRYAEVLSTPGNLNNYLGVPLTLLGEPHQPDAAVIEIGMNAPGEVATLSKIVAPTLAVVTGVALEHLEFMGSLEGIADAECESFASLPPDGVIAVPGDEPLLLERARRSGRKLVRFAAEAPEGVEVMSAEVGVRTRARLRIRGGETLEVELRLFGAHNARNAAAAITLGLELGLSLPAMAKAVGEVEPVGDRSRVLALGEHLLIADCYNANPGSMAVALRGLAALRSSRSGPLVAVLGDMLELGPQEHELHAEVGTLAAELGIDRVIGFGPRSAATVEAARTGGIEASAHASIEAIVEDLRRALAGAPPGAVLVKASRGMQLERVIEGLTG